MNTLLSSTGGGLNPVVALVLLALLAAGIAFALSRLRANPTSVSPDHTVFSEARQTAQEHRRRAEAALSRAQWGEAVVEGVRAMASGLVERGLVPEQADVTVHEISERASALFPGCRERLEEMSRVFDLTRYGARPAGRAGCPRGGRARARDRPSQPRSRGRSRSRERGAPMTVSAPARGARRSSRRTPLLIGLGMLLALVVISILTRDRATFPDPLDPRNPDRDGAQAIARVLDRQGVDVRVVRGQAAFLDARVDDATLVVVTNPRDLGESTLQRLRERADDAAALVVVGAAEGLVDQFDIDAQSSFSGDRPAGCDEDLARGLVVRTYGGSGLNAPGCFGSDEAAMLVHRDDLWLMASPESFTNQHVLDSDNGALALRLLGQQDRVVWYVADVDDTAVSDGVELSGLLPRWLVPGLYLLLAGVVALILLRGRRLGPLVTEPLPVVVRAAESTRSRGQIYRRTGDRQHAAAILVGAARRRLIEALRLPRGSSVDILAAAAASRTGRDPREVFDLLRDPVVAKDSQLVELGQRLLELENEVRTP